MSYERDGASNEKAVAGALSRSSERQFLHCLLGMDTAESNETHQAPETQLVKDQMPPSRVDNRVGKAC